MRAAVTALSWELLACHRWASILTAGWVVLLCLLGLVLAAAGCHPGVGIVLSVSLGVSLVLVLEGLTHGRGTRLESAGSCFPRRLFTLPVSASVLVGPPLLLGTGVIFLYWLLAVLCVLRPFGIQDVPLWWPALCGAAVLAWIQALSWFPFPLPLLRLGCLLVLLTGVLLGTISLAREPSEELLVFLGTIALVREAGENLLAGAFLVLLLLAYATAVVGVAWARRGTGIREPFQHGAVTVTTPRQEPLPFSSPLRAQLWLEWGRNRWGFGFIVVLCLTVSLPAMVMGDMVLRANEGLPLAFRWFQRALDVVGLEWLVMAYPLISAFLLGACSGGQMGRLRTGIGGSGCSPFLATRPLPASAIIKAKLLVCAGEVVFLWTLLFLGGLTGAACMGRLGAMSDRLVALTGSGPAALGVLIGGLLLLMALNWLAMIEGMWAGALGRTSLEMVPVAMGFLLWTAVALLVTFWRESWRPALEGGIVLALVGKTLAVAWVVRQSRRENILTVSGIICAVAAWVLFAATVTGLALTLISASAWVAGLVALLLPLARPLAAPLALRYNRTR
jgi:hypothetical protein